MPLLSMVVSWGATTYEERFKMALHFGIQIEVITVRWAPGSKDVFLDGYEVGTAPARSLCQVHNRRADFNSLPEVVRTSLLGAVREAGEWVLVETKDDQEPDKPLDCSRCGTSYEACTKKVRIEGKGACCTSCALVVTHNQGEWEAWEEKSKGMIYS